VGDVVINEEGWESHTINIRFKLLGFATTKEIEQN
jgi:hypothetical protein